MRKMSGER